MSRKKLDCCIDIIRNILVMSIIVIALFAYKGRKLHQNEVASQIPKNTLKYIFFKKNEYRPKRSIESIANYINNHNKQQIVLNEEVYGHMDKDTVTLVVTVHKLSIYLEFLLVSLSQVRGIEKALIVFSHSYFDEDVNDLIQSIDFARVMQIYYPYSVQLHPNEFPGFHPRDCHWTMTIEEAEAVNCTGASSPDVHGHYRNPAHSETKHQWWWTASTVFEILSAANNYTGTVLFLNDNVYLLQDFIYMVVSMTQIAEYLPSYDFLLLDAVTDGNKVSSYDLEIKQWVPGNSPGALAFNIATWRSIVKHYDLFCGVDDYSWARSLYYVSINRKDGLPYSVMSTAMARAFKTSSCGFEGKLVDCDAIESIYQVLNLQNKMKDELFPSYFDVYTLVEFIDEYEGFDFALCNGGWSDPRDKELCIKLTGHAHETYKTNKEYAD